MEKTETKPDPKISLTLKVDINSEAEFNSSILPRRAAEESHSSEGNYIFGLDNSVICQLTTVFLPRGGQEGDAAEESHSSADFWCESSEQYAGIGEGRDMCISESTKSLAACLKAESKFCDAVKDIFLSNKFQNLNGEEIFNYLIMNASHVYGKDLWQMFIDALGRRRAAIPPDKRFIKTEWLKDPVARLVRFLLHLSLKQKEGNSFGIESSDSLKDSLRTGSISSDSSLGFAGPSDATSLNTNESIDGFRDEAQNTKTLMSEIKHLEHIIAMLRDQNTGLQNMLSDADDEHKKLVEENKVLKENLNSIQYEIEDTKLELHNSMKLMKRVDIISEQVAFADIQMDNAIKKQFDLMMSVNSLREKVKLIKEDEIHIQSEIKKVLLQNEDLQNFCVELVKTNDILRADNLDLMKTVREASAELSRF
ncbi:uncharacterized protein LOC118181530 [Stegodyphus dumicola]|uniref:uncharacterized protein LOC118181530 n=1 Tax=Stegodyphus dumicola TaxID=202533 RepID=UPI0015AECFF4|nr:uncharacterized protein LOC118181530 [Stegodyphus dumicola]